MKRRIIIILCVFFGVNTYAQQLPQFTHYRFNQFAINPALAGFKECLDINIAYRNQWVGFDGAPQTGYLSASTKLGKSRSLQNIGIGGVLMSDQTGPFKRVDLNFALAYHFQWNRSLHGSMGLFLGAAAYKFSNSELNVPAQNLDPVLNGGTQAVLIIPQVTPGLWIYNNSFYMGLSIKSILGNKLKKIGNEAKLSQHIFLTSGKAYPAGEGKLVIPSFMLNYEPGSKASVNLNLMLQFKNSFGIGMSYRNVDALSALVKFRLMRYLTFGYSYDYTLSKIKVAGAKTHEISLNILSCPQMFGGGKKTPCAAYN